MKFMKKDSAEGAVVIRHCPAPGPEPSGGVREAAPGRGRGAPHPRRRPAALCCLRRPGPGFLPLGLCWRWTAAAAMFRWRALSPSPLNGGGTRGRQLFFVNGRLVKSQLLSAAVEEAYRNRLLKGKFPGCVLHITLPVNTVDVNVHPAKTVVKFAAEKAVFDAVHYTGQGPAHRRRKARAQAGQQTFYQSMTVQEYRSGRHPRRKSTRRQRFRCPAVNPRRKATRPSSGDSGAGNPGTGAPPRPRS